MSDLQTKHILLEVCIASVEDALAAQTGGAGRLELNAALALGGLTPSLGTLLEVKHVVALPVVTMLRPRPGGFAYSDHDFAVMRRDLDLLLAHGADGIAFGVLDEHGMIDERRCRTLLSQIGSATAVFHRAFDVTPEPFVALEQLIALGFQRVLTSGQEENAYNGSVLIAELIRWAAGRIEILPGGGVNRFTITDIVTRTGCAQVHASLRHSRHDTSTDNRSNITFGTGVPAPGGRYDTTNADAVVEVVELLRGQQEQAL